MRVTARRYARKLNKNFCLIGYSTPRKGASALWQHPCTPSSYVCANISLLHICVCPGRGMDRERIDHIATVQVQQDAAGALTRC